MRHLYLIILVAFLFWGCDKDKFTSEPQISFKSYKPAVTNSNVPEPNAALLILELTDSEGDIGFLPGSDTSKLYIKNLLTNKEDSVEFPNISAIIEKNFKADIEFNLFSVLGGRSLPSNQRPYSDTLSFEVYVKDFKKNKSNVLITPKSLIYHTLP